MNNAKFNLIVEKLLDRTKEGKIEWESTANINTFLTVLTDNTISIRPYWRGKTELSQMLLESVNDYVFDFRNENGDIVESVTVTDSNQDTLRKAKEIFKLAKKNSLKENLIADQILEQLAA